MGGTTKCAFARRARRISKKKRNLTDSEESPAARARGKGKESREKEQGMRKKRYSFSIGKQRKEGRET